MTPIALVTIDGVLKDDPSGAPIANGRRLYQGLASTYSLVLVADSTTDDLWLAVNGFDQHQNVVRPRPEDPGDVAIRRVRQIQRLRSMGASLGLLVEPDPGVVAAVMHTGVPCLHYVDPPYQRPEFHPDFHETVTPWEQMVAEINKTRALRAANTRHLEEI